MQRTLDRVKCEAAAHANDMQILDSMFQKLITMEATDEY